jgi:hypothetical protein
MSAGITVLLWFMFQFGEQQPMLLSFPLTCLVYSKVPARNYLGQVQYSVWCPKSIR